MFPYIEVTQCQTVVCAVKTCVCEQMPDFHRVDAQRESARAPTVNTSICEQMPGLGRVTTQWKNASTVNTLYGSRCWVLAELNVREKYSISIKLAREVWALPEFLSKSGIAWDLSTDHCLSLYFENRCRKCLYNCQPPPKF